MSEGLHSGPRNPPTLPDDDAEVRYLCEVIGWGRRVHERVTVKRMVLDFRGVQIGFAVPSLSKSKATPLHVMRPMASNFISALSLTKSFASAAQSPVGETPHCESAILWNDCWVALLTLTKLGHGRHPARSHSEPKGVIMF